MTNKPMLSVERELIQRIADHCKFWVDHPYLEAIADVEVELRALLDDPAKPAPECVGDLERFEADDGVFVRLGDVIDMLGNEKAAQHQGEPFTYSSKQATSCAGCGIRKHTPLRVDEMGGYVRLTCIDNRLGELLEAERHYGEPVARIEIGADRNAAMTITDNKWLRSLKDRGAHHIVSLYAAPVASAKAEAVRWERMSKMDGGTWWPCANKAEADDAVKCGWAVRPLFAEQPAPVAEVPEGYCIMPRRLTAENGAKALLLGEFKLRVTKECPECCELEEPTEGCSMCDGEGEYEQRHTISWDQIKFIYSQAVAGLARINKPL